VRLDILRNFSLNQCQQSFSQITQQENRSQTSRNNSPLSQASTEHIPQAHLFLVANIHQQQFPKRPARGVRRRSREGKARKGKTARILSLAVGPLGGAKGSLVGQTPSARVESSSQQERVKRGSLEVKVEGGEKWDVRQRVKDLRGAMSSAPRRAPYVLIFPE
jgi:hypothetical protein